MKIKIKVLFLLALLFFVSCGHNLSGWNGKIYKSNYGDMTIERRVLASVDRIHTCEPEFDNFFCMVDADLKNLIRAVNGGQTPDESYWSGRLYRSDYTKCAIRRTNSHGHEQIIYAYHYHFAGFYCMSESDLIDLIFIIWG
jgi:hypothetical protein